MDNLIADLILSKLLQILAGLLDQYTLAGNARALSMTKWMIDYFYNRVQNVIKKYSIERHWLSLNEETGGMNDILYRLYMITVRMLHLEIYSFSSFTILYVNISGITYLVVVAIK